MSEELRSGDERPIGPVSAGWDALATEITRCVRCEELAATRRQVVVGQAPAGARLALVGEAPGAQEDSSGVPFVGRAGVLLDELLAGAGLRRADVAVLNTVKCRPPANRTPRAGELGACRPHLERQLAVIGPELIVALGATAVGWFFGAAARIGALRGQAELRKGYPVLATYHPSAALRFGPKGVPMTALREDLALAARLLS